MVAAPYEQFDGSKFYDPKYVRTYRARMLKMIQLGQPGFGLRFEGQPSIVSIKFCDLNTASIKYQLRDNITINTTLNVDESGVVTQSATIKSTSSKVSQIRYTLGMNISVNRASYGQLTEGGPIPIPSLENELRILDDGHRYAILNRYLNAHLEGSLWHNGNAVQLSNIADQTFVGIPVGVSFSDMIDIPANSSQSLMATFRLIPDVVVRGKQEMVPPELFPEPHSIHDWTTMDSSDASFSVRRNLEYILGNCTIPVSDTEVALITDHVALPLGWNRDN